MLRNLTLALIAAALLSALPAAAASSPVSAPTACPQPSTLFDFASPQPNSTPAPPAWLNDPTPATTPVPYRGYCACECSTIRDCNTNADCSNHRCLKAISCC